MGIAQDQAPMRRLRGIVGHADLAVLAADERAGLVAGVDVPRVGDDCRLLVLLGAEVQPLLGLVEFDPRRNVREQAQEHVL